MASLLNQDFPDEEDEDDFNPQAEVGSDDEADAKPQDIQSDDGRPASRRISEEFKEEDPAKDGLVGFGRDVQDDEDANGEVNDDAGEEQEEGEAGGRNAGANGNEDEEDEDEEEEEDDEEDEDIEGPVRKRRRKHRRNQFIDVEAEVDEEDEEEPEEDDDLPPDEVHPDDLQDLPPGADRDDRKHRELDQQREQAFHLDAEEEAERLKERYGRSQRQTGGTGAIVPQKMLMPAAGDPRIWRLKCRPGKEKEIIMSIFDRISKQAKGREPIMIHSAFEKGGVMAGNLYVEAWQQEAVEAACNGITHIFGSVKPYMVPFEEAPALLKTQKSKLLEPGMYVRLKRGLYQGDLAQVEEVEANMTDVTCRLVPRLDYGMNEDANAPVEVDANGKRKRQIKPQGQRPPPRLFSEAEAKKKHGRYLSRNGMGNASWTYQNKDYINGFLVERFRISVLQTEDVNPTLEEVTKFVAGADDGTENLDLAALAATLKQSSAADYLPGDKVELFRGEQKGVSGTAVGVYGDVLRMKVETKGSLRGQVIEAPIKDLRKLFREGDHVKVIGGSKYFDEVGMVVKTKDDRVTILTDSNQQEITVFSKDLREATDAGGSMAGSKYALFDLVQLDVSTVGCVIKVDRESLRVLDQTGSVRTLLPSAISNRIERRRNAVATDRDGNEIKVDDTVKEFSGEQKEGRVLHMHRNFIFVQNRERAENSGIWVARQANVVTVAAKGGRANALDLTKMNPAAMKANGAPGGMAPPQARGRDRLIGKSVKLKKGTYKGMVGIIKDADGSMAKVELHAKNKVINVEKTSLNVIDGKTGATLGPADTFAQGRPFSGGMPARAPMGGSGGRTPFGGATSYNAPTYATTSSSRVPSWKQDAGSKTPAIAAGGGTAYGGFGGATAYGGNTSYGGTTSYGGGGGATSYGGGGGSVWGGGGQSTWNANAGGRTPAPSGSKTPAYAGALEAPTPGFNSAPTPGNYQDQPTPGGFRGGAGQDYRTPAAYQTPGGFPETPGAGGFEDDGPRYE